jgi:hypothetical protein
MLWAQMVARIFALAIALAVAGTGLLPTGDAVRCLITGKRIAAVADCCAKCHSPAVTAIGKPCCELVRGRSLEPRAPVSSSQDQRIAPAALIAVLFPPALASPAGARRMSVAALPPGRPPGERLERFSAILRV